jgi:hypothetical protein
MVLWQELVQCLMLSFDFSLEPSDARPSLQGPYAQDPSEYSGPPVSEVKPAVASPFLLPKPQLHQVWLKARTVIIYEHNQGRASLSCVLQLKRTHV